MRTPLPLLTSATLAYGDLVSAPLALPRTRISLAQLSFITE